MIENLVIVESPAKAKTIEKYLGKDYDVRASVGHIRDLPVSKLGVDVKKDFAPQYVTIKGKSKIISDLKREFIPELRRKLTQSGPYTQNSLPYSRTINNKDFLIISTMIPDKNKKDSQGILGVKINNSYLENDLLNNIIKGIHSGERINFTISNLTGRIIYGKKSMSEEFPKTTAFFENNFPPWRIEAYSVETKVTGLIGLHKSFYFWTILTLIIILSFGVVLIVRTVAHEVEVLKIKSDFVSSVSHEFKTPLTSIKALTERLMGGKVKDQAKMNQYFSVISQDTDKLTRLVGNILDFAKSTNTIPYEILTSISQRIRRKIL